MPLREDLALHRCVLLSMHFNILPVCVSGKEFVCPLHPANEREEVLWVIESDFSAKEFYLALLMEDLE